MRENEFNPFVRDHQPNIIKHVKCECVICKFDEFFSMFIGIILVVGILFNLIL